ncbi:MAG TPA: capsule assembly Wzi family protein [Candidatus Binataceae bacterium]|nr:capsule assembly Wzi family protein [Candidatus Binataceae bacterium]
MSNFLRRLISLKCLLALALASWPAVARASTYVVFIPLDSPVYEELDTLNGLGYLDTWLNEIKPISRVEAARLALEAEGNVEQSAAADPLAQELVRNLRLELHDEVGWLENNVEDQLPSMAYPIQRVETQLLYSRGEQRQWRTSNTAVKSDAGINAEESTPLLPYNDAIQTATGGNEIVRASGWAGYGGFLTAYAEGAAAGPLSRNIKNNSRLQLLGSGGVLSWGNLAISLGTDEMWWGAGHFGPLAQGNAASPFPAGRIQSIHPTLLPGFLRYLGQFRFQGFFGQLNSERYFSHPWIDGQIFSFKPLPNFEFGFTHTIMFGGSHNNNYSTLGFIGRATGFATGSVSSGDTNSRGGIYLKFRIPKLRNLEVYQEILGEDNLTNEVAGIGRFLPFLAVSYQGGFYLPRLTADGLTDFRFEYALLEPNYSTHGDSLYWTYDGQLMGNALGPNATEVDLQIGRWFNVDKKLSNKISLDLFYTEQAPGYGSNYSYPARFYPYTLGKEHSGGLAIDLFHLPAPLGFGRGAASVLSGISGRAGVEYVSDLNYRANSHSVRLLLMLSSTLEPPWHWQGQ